VIERGTPTTVSLTISCQFKMACGLTPISPSISSPMIRLSGNSQSAYAAKINLGESIEGIPSRGGPPPSISSRGIKGSSIENPLRWADSECSGLMKRVNAPAKKKPAVLSHQLQKVHASLSSVCTSCWRTLPT